MSKFYKNLTVSFFMFALIFVVQNQSDAATIITSTEVINNWTASASVMDNFQTGSWVDSAGTVTTTVNHSGKLVSDFTAVGDFSFSVDVEVGSDNTLGMIWGFQDADNMYRISWATSAGERVTGGVSSFANGEPGLKIIKEVSGFSTILHEDTGITNFNAPFPPEFRMGVTGTGTGFDILITDLRDFSSVLNMSFADTTFTSGNVGIHDRFQTDDVYSNFEFTQGVAVPEPTTVALLGIGLVGLAGVGIRHKWRKKAVNKN